MKFLLISVAILISTPIVFSEDQQKDICVVHWKSPTYNEVARQARMQGDVKLRVSIDKGGKVSKAIAIRSNAHKLLEDEAVKNITECTFNPGEERVFEMIYEFRLVLPEIYYAPPSLVTADFPSRVHIESNFKPIIRD